MIDMMKVCFAAVAVMVSLAGAAETLAEAVAKDLERPVRPGGVEGRPFWNRYSVQFMYPPAFEFAAVKGAAKYRFTVVDDVLNEHVFETDRPTADLSPVWKGVPVGFARVTVDGLGADGAVCGRAGTRRFWKAAAFEPPRAWGYGEAARRYYGYLFEQPNTVHFREKGTPDEEGFLDLPVVYPSKMNSALIQAMLRYAKACPERRDAAILTARKVADYMLSVSQPADAPLAHFPPTYWKKANQHLSFASVKYAGQNMLIYPAWMGDAYLDLHEATGERKYLDAALAIAATFERIQCSNGSWYVKVWEKDGKPVVEGENTEPYYIIPTDIYFFFAHLAAKTGDSRWTKVADRAFGYLEKGPMTTYDWAAQYEDTPPTKDYIGHSGDMAADAALILLDRYPTDQARIEQARELMRWVEDQFVFWTRPCRSDKRGILSEKSEAFSPIWDGSHPKYSFDNWLDVPSSTEKYGYTNPINSKTAKVMRLFLKMYRRTGDRLCLEKAKALGDGIVKIQAMVGTGNIPTHFWKTDCRGDRGENDWTNCGTFTALGLEELADELERGGIRTLSS